MKRIALTIGSLGLAAMLGLTMIGGVVHAQTTTPDTSANTSNSKKDQFLTTVASKLGVTTSALETALQQTADELGFGPGRLGGRFRERIHDGNQHKRDQFVGRMDLAQAATFLSISEDQLKTELQSGKTFIEVAREHGKTDDQIRAFLIERATAAIDERLQAASATATPTGA